VEQFVNVILDCNYDFSVFNKSIKVIRNPLIIGDVTQTRHNINKAFGLKYPSPDDYFLVAVMNSLNTQVAAIRYFVYTRTYDKTDANWEPEADGMFLVS
jgi:hypothetical protein